MKSPFLFLIMFCYLWSHVCSKPNNSRREKKLEYLRELVSESMQQGDTFSDCKKPSPKVLSKDCDSKSSYRTIDGSCNNLKNTHWGSANQPLIRLVKKGNGAEYQDSNNIDEPLGYPGPLQRKDLPTPHEVSKDLFHMFKNDNKNNGEVSTLHMTFGQFLDHDLSLSPHAAGECKKPKCKPGSDADFQYPCFPIEFSYNKDTGCTPFTRSLPVCQSTKSRKTRQQINVLTSYIDGSQIYGSNEELSKKLRGKDGKMKTSSGNLLPWDTDNSADPCKDRGGCFLAGDVRVNENIALAAMHTIFVREHNNIAKDLKQINPHWNDEKIYQTTRKIIGAILQKITYDEFLPRLATLPEYNGYDLKSNPSIINAFSTAAFRYGHSLIKNSWAQLDKNFDVMKENLPLRATFFNITAIKTDGVEPTVFGLAGNLSQEVDLNFASSVGEKLFIPPKKRGRENLLALNLQRGRDHGLLSYTEYRKFCKLGVASKWSDLKKDIPDAKILDVLEKLYGKDLSKTHVDLFSAALAEEHVPGKIVGPTLNCIIGNQFTRLRDGDRFFYKNEDVFTSKQRNEIEKITMAKVLCRTLKRVVSMQNDVFKGFAKSDKRHECTNLPGINLEAWKENPYKDFIDEEKNIRNNDITQSDDNGIDKMIEDFITSKLANQIEENDDMDTNNNDDDSVDDALNHFLSNLAEEM